MVTLTSADLLYRTLCTDEKQCLLKIYIIIQDYAWNVRWKKNQDTQLDAITWLQLY